MNVSINVHCKKSILSKNWLLHGIKWLSESLRGLKKPSRSTFWVLFCGHASQQSRVTSTKPSPRQEETCHPCVMLWSGRCCFRRQLQTTWRHCLPCQRNGCLSCHSISHKPPGPCTVANAARGGNMALQGAEAEVGKHGLGLLSAFQERCKWQAEPNHI